jgi:hypothetical protein
LVTERLIVASLDGIGRDPVCKRTHLEKIFPGFADMIIAPRGARPIDGMPPWMTRGFKESDEKCWRGELKGVSWRAHRTGSVTAKSCGHMSAG